MSSPLSLAWYDSKNSAGARVLDKLYPNTTDEVRAARLRICERAETVDEAREFLDMLGLLP